uniref:ATP-dependent (S)-NAD(P)H-hydrate dehydratase n=1 Tax=Arcella intermedia TaxID=1963864 RepID=A0A6B2LAY6_9EUKA
MGGSFEYTGAPYIAAISALKTGADLSFVFCSRDAGTAIKSYGPEIIVLPSLRTQQEAENDKHPQTSQQIVSDVMSWVKRLHVLVVGPGLGRDQLMQETTKGIIDGAKKSNIPLVIDADALWAVENDPSLVQDYKPAILTPNINEFRRICTRVLSRDVTNEDRNATVMELAKKLGYVTIVSKGPTDIISDGNIVVECSQESSPRRVGGQGDVLAGTIGTFVAWANREDLQISPAQNETAISKWVLAAYGGCTLTRDSAKTSFSLKKRSMVAYDLVEVLGPSFFNLFEHKL